MNDFVHRKKEKARFCLNLLLIIIFYVICSIIITFLLTKYYYQRIQPLVHYIPWFMMVQNSPCGIIPYPADPLMILKLYLSIYGLQGWHL